MVSCRLEQEQAERGDRPGRYFVLSAGAEGWGNRLLVLASALLFCLQVTYTSNHRCSLVLCLSPLPWPSCIASTLEPLETGV